MTRALAIGLALALVGCADNAVLEVELTLPAQPATGAPLFAYVQVRSGDVLSFDEAWAGIDAIEGRALEEGASVLPFSVVAGGASFTRQLGIRVRFCVRPDCGGVGDDRAPETRYRIERAFYRGHRTRLTRVIAELPPPASPGAPILEIGKCDIEGCTSGTTSRYCYVNDQHFCEE